MKPPDRDSQAKPNGDYVRINFIDGMNDIIEHPHVVELDGIWVHIVAYDSLGTKRRLFSYPNTVIGSIDWQGQV